MHTGSKSRSAPCLFINFPASFAASDSLMLFTYLVPATENLSITLYIDGAQLDWSRNAVLP